MTPPPLNITVNHPFEDVSEDKDGSVYLAGVCVNGTHVHLYAIQVELETEPGADGEGEFKPVNDAYREEVDATYSLLQDIPSTMAHEGRQFFLLGYPHGD